MENRFLSEINGMQSVTKTFLIFAIVSLLLKFQPIAEFFKEDSFRNISLTLASVYIGMGLIILLVAYFKDREIKSLGENINKEEGKKEKDGITGICAYSIGIIVVGLIFLA